MATLFFEPSTRTRSSFELAAGSGCAEFLAVQQFPQQGRERAYTARTYVAMGRMFSWCAIVQPVCPGSSPGIEMAGERTVVLNGGMGCTAIRARGCSTFTPGAPFRSPAPMPEALQGRRIPIVGDILHSRVRAPTSGLSPPAVRMWCSAARPVWCRMPCGFREGTATGQALTLFPRGAHSSGTASGAGSRGVDAVMTLRLQKERMGGSCSPASSDITAISPQPRAVVPVWIDCAVLHPGRSTGCGDDRRSSG